MNECFQSLCKSFQIRSQMHIVGGAMLATQLREPAGTQVAFGCFPAGSVGYIEAPPSVTCLGRSIDCETFHYLSIAALLIVPNSCKSLLHAQHPSNKVEL